MYLYRYLQHLHIQSNGYYEYIMVDELFLQQEVGSIELVAVGSHYFQPSFIFNYF